MRKIFLVILFTSLGFLSLSAQMHEVRFSEKEKISKKDGKVPGYVFGVSDKSAFQLRFRYQVIPLLYGNIVKIYPMISRIDTKSLQMEWSKPLITKEELPKGVKMPSQFMATELVDDKIFVAFYDYIPKDKAYRFYAKMLNADGENHTMLLQIAEEKVDKSTGIGMPDLIFTNDHKHFMIMYRLIHGKKDAQVYVFRVFDMQLNEVSHRQLEFPVQERYIALNQVSISNDLEVYVAASVYDDDENNNSAGRRKRVKSKTGSWTVHMFAFRPDNESEIHDMELNLSGKIVTGLRFKIQENRLIAGGFYGKQPGAINGVISLIYDTDAKEFIATNSEEFPKNVITDFTKGRKPNELGLAAMRLRELSVSNDGSYYMLGEEYYVTIHTRTDSKGYTTSYYKYHYDNILLTRVGPNGEIMWYRKINKKAETGVEDTPLFVGYYFHHNQENDMAYLVFNDHPINLGTITGGKPKDALMGNSNVVVVSVTPNGEMNKSNLWSNRDQKLGFHPELSCKAGDNMAFLSCQRGRKASAAYITFSQR